jgi:hypothetical protein
MTYSKNFCIISTNFVDFTLLNFSILLTSLTSLYHILTTLTRKQQQ